MSYFNSIYIGNLAITNGLISQTSSNLDIQVDSVSVLNFQSDGVHLQTGKTIYTDTSEMATKEYVQSNNRTKITWGSRINTLNTMYLRYNGNGRGTGNTSASVGNYYFCPYAATVKTLLCTKSGTSSAASFGFFVNDVLRQTIVVAAGAQVHSVAANISLSAGDRVAVCIDGDIANPGNAMADMYIEITDTSSAFPVVSSLVESDQPKIEDAFTLDATLKNINSTYTITLT